MKFVSKAKVTRQKKERATFLQGDYQREKRLGLFSVEEVKPATP